MKNSKPTSKILSALLLLALMFVFVQASSFSRGQVFAFNTTSGSVNYVKVAELWDDDSQSFVNDNLNTLLKYVSGNVSFTMHDFSQLYEQAEHARTAADIRKVALPGKTNQQDVVVSYGGKDWTVTYLSLDKNGDIILTLWLADIEKNVNAEKTGDKVGWLSDKRKASYARLSSAGDERPDALYGTSYVRAVVLNNGGSYNSWDNEYYEGQIAPNTESFTATKQQDSVFAKFTYDAGDKFLDYIDSPRDVAWQESGEYAQQTLLFEYNLSNEMWSKEISDDGFSLEYVTAYFIDGGWKGGVYTENNMNMASKENNDSWADDKLWLPSMSEIGYCRGQAGLWETTMEQRTASEDYFTRTMKNNSTNHIYSISKDATCYNIIQVVSTAAVRPALHLNISKALKNSSDEVSEIRVSGTLKDGDLFDKSKLTVYGIYESGYIEVLNQDINFEGYTAEAPLVAGQAINISYNGHNCQYTVLKTTLTKGNVTFNSKVGFDNNADLELNKITEGSEIKNLIGNSIYQQLGAVEMVYQINVKNGELELVDESAGITISTQDLQGEYKFYIFNEGKISQVWTNQDKNLNLSGTKATLIFAKVSMIDNTDENFEPAAPVQQDIVGIILIFVFLMILITCATIVVSLILSKRKKHTNS